MTNQALIKVPLHQFVAERDEVLFSLDESRIRDFASKYGFGVSDNPEIFWAGVYKAICEIITAPADLKLKALSWLVERGYYPGIGTYETGIGTYENRKC
jgi:hypothetical protein